MMSDEQTLLDELRAQNNLRTLPPIRTEGKYLWYEGGRFLNFSSNDYLGITCENWHHEFMAEVERGGDFLLSNPSSRLLTGNSPDYTRLEELIASLYGRPALVLGSGYLLNSGVLPALTAKGDLILADKLVHASLIDGLRLSDATTLRYAHNDLEHLERLLRKHRASHNRVWIVTESLFSMDGDRAPLTELVTLKKQYDARLYLDEAHAFGVCGPGGRGLAAEAGVANDCDILVATLGKAIASQGAFLISDDLSREVLINRMRTLIFSTALPPISLRWSEAVIRRLDTPEGEAKRQHLRHLSEIVSGEADSSHIIPLLAGENSRAIEMSRRIREAGYWVTPIRTPTVPAGNARVRISLSAALSSEEAEQFAALCKSAF